MSQSRERSLGSAAQTSAALVSVVMVVGLLEYPLPGLERLGIQPRTLGGLVGVVCAPLLHAGVPHLMANLLPLFVLVTLLFWDRRYRPEATLAALWLGSGLGTWLIGRGGRVHLGASSLIYGLVAYLVTAGVLMRSWRSAGVALLVLFLYGGIIFGLLPSRGPVSWEGHLSGVIVGVWLARRDHG